MTTEPIDVEGPLTLRGTTLPRSFHFHGTKGKLLRITSEGKMEIGEGLSADEATAKVAALLVEHYGRQVTNEIRSLEAERDALKAERDEFDAALGDQCTATADCQKEIARLTSHVKELEAERDGWKVESEQWFEAMADNGAAAINLMSKLEAAEAERDRLASRVERLEKAALAILPYLHWTIGEESPGYPPTMPSAVVAFDALLKETEE